MENILKSITGKNKANGKKTLLACGTVGIGGLILALAVVYLHQEPQPLLSVTGLAEGYSIETVVESRAGTETVLAGQTQKAISPPYRLNTSLILPGDSYRDFVFMINEAGSEVSVIADGFHARDLISVRMDGETVLDKIPADWSGRLQLYAALPAKRSVTACVDIAGKMDSLGLCHTIIRGASS